MVGLILEKFRIMKGMEDIYGIENGILKLSDQNEAAESSPALPFCKAILAQDLQEN
jgi:hypothetical protein